LPNKIGQHFDKRGVVVDGGGPMEAQSQFLCHPSRLYIKVVQYLHVLTHEPNRHDDHIPHPIPGQPRQNVTDVGL
jgi:hypothetical protein